MVDPSPDPWWQRRRATAKDPTGRFATVADFVDALEMATTTGMRAGRTSGTPATTADDLPNPYQGLRAFDEGDRDLFFGRQRLVGQLVARLAGNTVRSRCLVVVGPPGSGKSSVVRAGLIPAIRSGAVPGSAEWFVTTMVPGRDPFESLEAALLRVAVNPPIAWVGQLRDGSEASCAARAGASPPTVSGSSS